MAEAEKNINEHKNQNKLGAELTEIEGFTCQQSSLSAWWKFIIFSKGKKQTWLQYYVRNVRSAEKYVSEFFSCAGDSLV